MLVFGMYCKIYTLRPGDFPRPSAMDTSIYGGLQIQSLQREVLPTVIRAQNSWYCLKSLPVVPLSRSLHLDPWKIRITIELHGLYFTYVIINLQRYVFKSRAQGSLFFVISGETSLEKTPIFSWFYKKLGPFYKKLNFDNLYRPKSQKFRKCSWQPSAKP